MRYSYTNETTGATIIENFSMGKAPKSIRRHGLRFKKDLVADNRRGYDDSHYQGNIWRGKENCMSGVHPKQLPALIKRLKAKGMKNLPRFKVNPRGTAQPVYESRAQRNEYYRARGWVDLDAGYGDAS